MFLLPLLLATAVGGALVAFMLTRGSRGGGGSRAVLVEDKYISLKLKDKIEVSHDSYIFRFALPRESDTLGLPIGQHITLRAMCDVQKTAEKADGTQHVTTERELVQHTYTPITSDDDKGYVDFMIKVYFAGVHPKFPHGGRLSQYLYKMKIGEEMQMMGPKGHFTYHLNGTFAMHRPGTSAPVRSNAAAFAMVAGGTGITPLLQIMRAIHNHPTDHTKVFLVYSNKTEDDILLKKELDKLAEERPDQFHIFYTLTQQVPSKWPFGTGRVDEMMLRKHLPSPTDFGGHVHALLCGPAGMLSQAVKPSLAAVGYPTSNIFAF